MGLTPLHLTALSPRYGLKGLLGDFLDVFDRSKAPCVGSTLNDLTILRVLGFGELRFELIPQGF